MPLPEQLTAAIVHHLDYEQRRFHHLILNGDGDFMWVASVMEGDDVVWSDPSASDRPTLAVVPRS